MTSCSARNCPNFATTYVTADRRAGFCDGHLARLKRLVAAMPGVELVYV